MSTTQLSWPVLTRNPSGWNWRLIANTQTFTSPLNGSEQTLEFPGARWWFRLTYEKLREEDWRVLSAFLASLRGMAGRVLLSPVMARTPRGAAIGSPIVSGADQTGRSLATSGWQASTAQIMRVGDYFSVPTLAGPELKILTEDAASAADGSATLKFEPPLRNSPNNGAVITTTSPVSPMRLYDGDQGEMATVLPRYASATLDFVESWI